MKVNYQKCVVHVLRLLGVTVMLFPSSSGASLSVFQAEDGSLSDVSISTVNIGFEGTGYGDYSDNGGGSIEWTYNAVASGDVDVQIRYATRNARPLDLFVDGSKRVTFDCASTGSWTSWETETALLSLSQGVHTLRLEAPFTGPNVDWLSVQSHAQSQPVPTSAPTASAQSRSAGPSTLVYQAESAIANKIALQTMHDGYDGSGYADFGGLGAFLLWTIDVPSSSSYELKVKYASGNERNCNLYIDGVFEGTFSFGGTGAWSNWDYESMVVALSQGVHELEILAENSSGPNIDWLSVTNCESCSGTAPAPTPRAIPITPQPSVSGAYRNNFASRVVVRSNSRLNKDQFVFSRKFWSSPSSKHCVGLTSLCSHLLSQRTENSKSGSLVTEILCCNGATETPFGVRELRPMATDCTFKATETSLSVQAATRPSGQVKHMTMLAQNLLWMMVAALPLPKEILQFGWRGFRAESILDAQR